MNIKVLEAQLTAARAEEDALDAERIHHGVDFTPAAWRRFASRLEKVRARIYRLCVKLEDARDEQCLDCALHANAAMN